MYYHGRGVKQDDVEAAKWFHLAADQDEPRAQFNLGVMHAEGQGVPQDYVEAIKWYRLAAEQGEARAQFNLGVSYAEGQGTDQNYILAYMWFNLAAPRFLPSEADRRRVALHNRDLTASRMSREQIAEAQTDVARVAAERRGGAGRVTFSPPSVALALRVRKRDAASSCIARGPRLRSVSARAQSRDVEPQNADTGEVALSGVRIRATCETSLCGICRRPWIPELRTHPAGSRRRTRTRHTPPEHRASRQGPRHTPLVRMIKHSRRSPGSEATKCIAVRNSVAAWSVSAFQRNDISR